MKKTILLSFLLLISPMTSASFNIPILNIPINTPEPSGGIRHEKSGDYNMYLIDSIDSSIYKNAQVFYKSGYISYIKINSKFVGNDYKMQKVVSIYKGEKEKLARLYPIISSHEYINLGNRYEISEPLKCLNYLDCGKYNTYFQATDDITVRIEIKSKDINTAYIEVSLQNDDF